MLVKNVWIVRIKSGELVETISLSVDVVLPSVASRFCQAQFGWFAIVSSRSFESMRMIRNGVVRDSRLIASAPVVTAAFSR